MAEHLEEVLLFSAEHLEEVLLFLEEVLGGTPGGGAALFSGTPGGGAALGLLDFIPNRRRLFLFLRLMALAVPVLIHSKSIPSSLRLLEMSVSVASSRKSGRCSGKNAREICW